MADRRHAQWREVLSGPLLLLVAAAVASLWPQSAGAQQSREEFDETMRQWKETYVELAEIFNEFQICPQEESSAIAQRFHEVQKRGDALRLKAIGQAAALHAASPHNLEEINSMLAQTPVKLFDQHQYELAASVSAALFKHDPRNSGRLFDAIKNSFFSNQFDRAAELADVWVEQFGEPPAQLAPIVSVLPGYQTAWAAELEARKKQATGEPLPRISIETPNGTFVVELFEDEFPVVVNNLINLVEEHNLYQGWLMFEVLEHQFVHGGCPNNDGTSTAPVGPVDRSAVPPWSHHFRGSFSLLVDPANSFATTQFFVTRIPMPEFDAHSVVVGRVIEGMEVVDNITETHKLDRNMRPEPLPDVSPEPVMRTTVVSKRDHAYEFRQSDKK